MLIEMKTLYLSIIAILAFISSISIMTGAFAQNETSTNTNNVEIQNIQVEPSAIKVGDTLKITATLVNNSTNPIFLSYGVCEGKFSVIFDNHVAVDKKNVPCVLMAIEQRLDPGTKTTGTSPGSFPPHGTPTVTYTANATGIANATVTFSYSDSGIEKTISKSFQFQVHDVNETYAQKPPVYFGLPLEQFKSGTPALDVKCNDGLQLILKAEDASPACVKPDTAQILIERGWAWNYANVVGKESISLSAYHGISNETFYDNGTIVSDFSIDVNIKNFKPSNTSLVLQVYYNDGILYKTVSVPSGMIQPDGFYGYHLIAVSDENHPVPFKVVATYNNETTMAYAPVFAHP